MNRLLLAAAVLLLVVSSTLTRGEGDVIRSKETPTDDLITSEEFEAKLVDHRCLGEYNSTCLGVYPGRACKGDFVAFRCEDNTERRSSSEHEERACSDMSYKVYHWKQIATNAQTPTNNFYTTNDYTCENTCYQYMRAGSWVVGWTRDWANGNCQCFVIPYGSTMNNHSARRAQATTGFFRNEVTGIGCGAYLITHQRTWSGVIHTMLTAGPLACGHICRSMGIYATTYKDDGNCYCLNTNWLDPPMTYTPDSGMVWSTTFMF